MPIYLVSADMKILYCNDALCQLTGHDDEFLTELTCVYQTATDQPPSRQLASGLCPPPDCFHGDPGGGWIAIPREGQTEYREATFVPSHPAASPGDTQDAGVVVFVHGSAKSRPAADMVAEEAPDPRKLHAAICYMQYESANSISIDCLVGRSPESLKVRRQVELAGQADVNVLIVGPVGSGRSKVVPLIHFANGPEMAGPLIPIDCALTDQEAIQETIKTLFRAQKQYPDEPLGRVFLQNLDQLPQTAQQELVGFLRLPDFRLPLIATLQPGSESSVLKELLQYVGTLTIELASLASRRQDIPYLVQAILEQFNDAKHAQLASVSDDTMSLLVRYSWPGELNELIETLDAACRDAQPPTITTDNLPSHMRIALRADSQPVQPEKTVIDLDAFLAEIEDELIRRAVSHTAGNKSEAARLLGISRPRLLRRLDATTGESAKPDFTEAGDQEDPSSDV